jgi:outer membrane protein
MNQFEGLKSLLKVVDSSNIDLRIIELQKNIKEENIKDAKHDFYPHINFQNSNNLSRGRFLDPYTNRYNNKTAYFNSIALNSGINIYQGGAVRANLNLNKSALAFEILQGEITKKSIYNEVAEAYFSALTSKEHIILLNDQLILLEQESNIIDELVLGGHLSEYEKFEQKSRQRSIRNEQENTKNDLSLSLDRIYFLSGIKFIDSLVQLEPNAELGINRHLDVTQTAIYKSKAKTVEISKYKLKLVKSAQMPHIYLSSSIVTGYSESQVAMRDGELKIIHPAEQYRNNINSVSVLNLSIPIYSKRDIRTRINIQKINHTKNQLELDNSEKELNYLILSRLNSINFAEQSYKRLNQDINDKKEVLNKYQELLKNGKISMEIYNKKSNELLELKKEFIQWKYNYLLTLFIFKNDFLNEF